MTVERDTFLAYERLVSLGNVCQTAAQIRRYTGVDMPGLFDWIQSDWKGLTKCIKNDFSEFFKLHNLKAIQNDETVLDTATGFEFSHLYGVPGSRKIQLGMIERDYHEHELALRFLIRDLNHCLDEERVLLVRQGNPKPEQVLELWNALERAHPAGSFDLLIVNTTRIVTTVDHPRIRVGLIQPPPKGPNEWVGDDVAWNKVLTEHAPLNRRGLCHIALSGPQRVCDPPIGKRGHREASVVDAEARVLFG